MAQGLIKKKTASHNDNNKKHPKNGITKKGARVLAPRKQVLQKRAKLNKKLTAGLTAQTEKMLGEKAGYLEMIGKGRNKTSSASGKVDGKDKGGKKAVAEKKR